MHSAELILVLLAAQPVFAGEEESPDCPPHVLCLSVQDPVPLARQVEQSVVALVVKPVESSPRDQEAESPGETSFEIVEVLRDSDDRFTQGETVTYRRDIGAKEGGSYLLFDFHKNRKDAQWSRPVRTSDAMLRYVKGAPDPDTPVTDRLRYFLPFLEHDDVEISSDAYRELRYADHTVFRTLKADLPTETLRSWVSDREMYATRVGFCSELLGLVGNADDAAFLEARILESPRESRLGVDGMVAGYLMLTGEEGLDVIDREKLADPEQPLSEVYASMQSLQFIWTYEPELFSRDRLRASMRLLLERPDLAEFVVDCLARWHDWSVTDRLMELYDEEFSEPGTRNSIIRYYLSATNTDMVNLDDEDVPPAETVTRCSEYLSLIRTRDPERVEQVERNFFEHWK